MPCDICHSLLVRKNGTILCPSCNKIQLLERNTTVNVLQKNLDDVEAALFSLVKKRGLDKTKLLDALTWQREKFARDFFEVYQGFDLIKFLTLNLLIFRLMKEDLQGNGLPSDEEIEDMIRAFSDYLRMKHMYLLFKNGFAEAIRSNGKIQTIPNERYFPIEKSYEDSPDCARS